MRLFYFIENFQLYQIIFHIPKNTIKWKNKRIGRIKKRLKITADVNAAYNIIWYIILCEFKYANAIEDIMVHPYSLLENKMCIYP